MKKSFRKKKEENIYFKIIVVLVISSVELFQSTMSFYCFYMLRFDENYNLFLKELMYQIFH